MAKAGNYRQAQTLAKVHNRMMKANVNSSEQAEVIGEYSKAISGAYNMMSCQHV